MAMSGSNMHLSTLEVVERLLELLAEKDLELQALYEKYSDALTRLRPVSTRTGSTLVVESRAAERVGLAHLLLEEGIAVRTAADGIEAIEAIAAQQFHAILFDYCAPRVQPADFVSVVATRRPNTAIYVLTPDEPQAVVRDELVKRGAKMVLPKPVDPTRLLKLLSFALPAAA